MIAEHTKAVLLVDLPDYDLKAGDVGIVVHIYKGGEGYELEFFTLEGQTIDVVTVNANQVRPVSHRDVWHVRELSA